jgi:hypothetical protein
MPEIASSVVTSPVDFSLFVGVTVLSDVAPHLNETIDFDNDGLEKRVLLLLFGTMVSLT